jgi:hypothetical protein
MHQLKNLMFVIMLPVVVAALVIVSFVGIDRFTGNAKSVVEQLNSTPVFVTRIKLNQADFFMVYLSNSVNQTLPDGSLQIPFEKLAEKATLQQIKSSGKKILLVSEMPGQSAKAWVILNQLGVKNLFILAEENNPEILRYKFVPDTTKTDVSVL